jgi:phosphate/sulfate permease
VIRQRQVCYTHPIIKLKSRFLNMLVIFQILFHSIIWKVMRSIIRWPTGNSSALIYSLKGLLVPKLDILIFYY